MEDEKGMDEKILAVPAAKLTRFMKILIHIKTCQRALLMITHFFEHYKDLEKGKWVKVKGFEDADKAKQLIEEGIQRNGK